jgi:hypothetical protein
MSEIDLEVLYNTLVDHFSSTLISVVQNPLSEEDDALDLYEVFDKDGSDVGVTKFKTMTDTQLADLLDFPKDRPILFAKYRHLDPTITSWARGWQVVEPGYRVGEGGKPRLA